MKKSLINARKVCTLLLLVFVLGLSGCKKSSNAGTTTDEVLVDATNETNTTDEENSAIGTTSDEATVTPEVVEEVVNERDIKAEDIDWSVVPEELRNSEYDLRKALSVTPLKDAYADYFSIGVGINGSNLSNCTLKSPEMTAIAEYHFNSATYSNLMKPSYLLDQFGCKESAANGNGEPVVKFDAVIDGLEWCKANGIKMRGHTLVWHTQVPDWFYREGYENTGSYVDKATLLMRLESYIKQVLTFTQTNYPGVIYCWDVVNEAVENRFGYYDTESSFQVRTHWDVNGVKTENPWYKIIGEEYVEKSFEFARKYADPEVKLFYNDYNTFQRTKCMSIYTLAKQLKEKGLIDGIGMQSYYDLVNPKITYGNDSTRDAIERFAKLDVEIQLTELSLNCKEINEENYEKQAERYKELFDLLLLLDSDNGGVANITNVTFFGVMDQYLFYPGNTENTRLFDGKLQPKPAYYSVMDAVREFEANQK